MRPKSRKVRSNENRKVRVASEGEVRGQPLSEAERRQIMHMLDISEARKTAARSKGLKVFEHGAMTYQQIAELTGKHPNTIAKMKRERDQQQCTRVADVNGFVRTVEIPQPGQRGGRRWSRMNEEQMRMCTRIAVENPRLTAAQIRERMQTEFPTLTMCDSTVLRALHSSNLQFLRAKMRDPRSDGTPAHEAEKRAFLSEQKKGDAGELGANDLFFMDETTVYLNLTAKRAWGTTEHPAEILHAKGKTMTIGIYAGLGLVSDTKDNWSSEDEAKTFAPTPTDPRGNAYEYSAREDKWFRPQTPPRFMLFWWLRPPTRDKTVLSRFLDVNDILDPAFRIRYGGEEFHPITNGKIAMDAAKWTNYFKQEWNDLTDEELAKRLWQNGIEYRQVDEAGDLITIMSANKKSHKVWVSPTQMREYLFALQALVARAMLTVVEDADLRELFRNNASSNETRIPRYYFTATGRNTLGGTRTSDHGDQSLFLRYLQHHVQYVEENFPPQVRSNLRDAWDSAPQHGKTDLTSNTKSFVHEWVQNELNIRGAIFLPVREPDFNPVELLFAFIKSVIRRRFPGFTGEVSEDQMVSLIDQAFGEVTEEMVKGWLRYGCYVIPGDPSDTLHANQRCGYERVIDIEHYWERIVTDWEARHSTPLEPHARARILDANPSEAYPFMARFATVADALGDDKVNKIDDPIKKVEVDGIDATDNTSKPIPLTAKVSLLRLSSTTPTIFSDNYQSSAYKELHSLLELRRDTTGLRLIHRYLQILPGSDAVKAAADNFIKFFSEDEGLLHVLKQAKDNALKIAKYFSMAQPVDPLDKLLDVQERIFHPKLDTVRTQLAISRENVNIHVQRLSIPSHRSVPAQYTLTQYKLPDSAPMEGTPCRIKAIDSKTVTLVTNSNKTVVIGNARLYNAMDLKDESFRSIKTLANDIRKLLASTPYESCVVVDDVNWPYAAAVVALKAYRFERDRMGAIGKQVVHDFIAGCGEYDTLPDPAQDAAKRAFQRGLRRWKRLRDDDTSNLAAAEQAPFFVVADLRAKRRMALQLKLLARHENQRRWPGYPINERNERDGVPIRTVEPSDRVNLSPARPIRFIHIHGIYPSKRNEEYVDATLTFEDGDTLKLLPPVFEKDDEMKEALKENYIVDGNKIINRKAGIQLLIPSSGGTEVEVNGKKYKCINLNIIDYAMNFKHLFGPFSEYNQTKLDLAKQRFNEYEEKKAKEEKAKDVFTKYMESTAVVGTYKTHSIYYSSETLADPDYYLLFDAEKSCFYPPPHLTLENTRQLAANNKEFGIALTDPAILNRNRLATHWIQNPTAADADKLTELPPILRPGETPVRISIETAKVNGEYRLAYKKPSDGTIWVVAWQPLTVKPKNIHVDPEDIKAYPLAQFLPRCRVYSIANAPEFYRMQLSRSETLRKEYVLDGTVLKVKIGNYENIGDILYLDNQNILLKKRALKELYKKYTLIEMDQHCAQKSIIEEVSLKKNIDFQVNDEDGVVQLLI